MYKYQSVKRESIIKCTTSIVQAFLTVWEHCLCLVMLDLCVLFWSLSSSQKLIDVFVFPLYGFNHDSAIHHRYEPILDFFLSIERSCKIIYRITVGLTTIGQLQPILDGYHFICQEMKSVIKLRIWLYRHKYQGKITSFVLTKLDINCTNMHEFEYYILVIVMYDEGVVSYLLYFQLFLSFILLVSLYFINGNMKRMLQTVYVHNVREFVLKW